MGAECGDTRTYGSLGTRTGRWVAMVDLIADVSSRGFR
jgi:hypothetical protein